MKTEMPTCKKCLYMSMLYQSRITRNNNGQPRTAYICEHPKVEEIFYKVCPRSPRMAGFIGYSVMGGNVPQIKTSPRWCPLRFANQKGGAR